MVISIVRHPARLAPLLSLALCLGGSSACREVPLVAIEKPAENPELCDGIDNDLDPATPDGSQDPLLGSPCDGEDQDLCQEGALRCVAGALACDDVGGDNAELCDGVDNDCDPSTPDGASEVVRVSVTACSTSWDRRPVIEFDPLPAGHSYELFVTGSSSPLATITLEGQNYFRPEAPIGPGGPPPGAGVTISLFDCKEQGAGRCCASAGSVTVQLIESCTAPEAPSRDNLIISEYVVNGDGSCPGPDCEAGEAFEITNLSHCPVALDGYHFSYCSPKGCSTLRWMNFDATAVVPPRGVYVAMRQSTASVCDYPFLGADDPGVHGLNVSILAVESDTSLSGGWFNNGGGGRLRIASGAFVDMSTGTELASIEPYLGRAGECESIGFNAWDACGNITNTEVPTEVLTPNQLGRLWKPCDAVVTPFPDTCQ